MISKWGGSKDKSMFIDNQIEIIPLTNLDGEDHIEFSFYLQKDYSVEIFHYLNIFTMNSVLTAQPINNNKKVKN